MITSMEKILKAVNEEKNRYHEHSVSVSWSTNCYNVGIRHAITYQEMNELVDAVVKGSFDDDGNYNYIYHKVAHIFSMLSAFTDIPVTEVPADDIILFWDLSDIEDVISSVAKSYAEICNEIDRRTKRVDTGDYKLGKVCDKILSFIDNISSLANEYDELDDDEKEKLIDGFGKEDWKGIVDRILDKHEDNDSKLPIAGEEE